MGLLKFQVFNLEKLSRARRLKSYGPSVLFCMINEPGIASYLQYTHYSGHLIEMLHAET